MDDLGEYIARKLRIAIRPQMEVLDLHFELINFDDVVANAITDYEIEYHARVNVE